jgi:hypothetical protein
MMHTHAWTCLLYSPLVPRVPGLGQKKLGAARKARAVYACRIEAYRNRLCFLQYLVQQLRVPKSFHHGTSPRAHTDC